MSEIKLLGAQQEIERLEPFLYSVDKKARRV